jgi:uncharacterized metal-binding protein
VTGALVSWHARCNTFTVAKLLFACSGCNNAVNCSAGVVAALLHSCDNRWAELLQCLMAVVQDEDDKLKLIVTETQVRLSALLSVGTVVTLFNAFDHAHGVL